jgi:mRNA-degrading endonuclease RelE of RelBE toxin-antitoxin system
LKHSVYKIGLKSSDITKGKSGAFRVIYYVLFSDGRIYLLTIYSKSEKENICWEEIDDIIKQI